MGNINCVECKTLTTEYVTDDRTGYKYCNNCYAQTHCTCPGCLRVGVRLWRNTQNQILCSECIEGNRMLSEMRTKCSKCGTVDYQYLSNWLCEKCFNDRESQPKFVVRECIDVRSVQRNFLIINTKNIKIYATCYNQTVAEFMCEALNNGNENMVNHL